MRWLWLRVALAALILAWPGGAQAAEPSDVESVVRGIEAQRQAALIRERRLADDRETALIAGYETRLRAARRRYDRSLNGARAEAQGARAELETARANFAAFVAGIAQRDVETRAMIAAYAAEARQLAAQASPERLAALARFADGDRVGAWPVLQALTLAADRAAERASNMRRAVVWRENAQLREVMRRNGEATTSDVIELWEMAARLDPDDLWTQIGLARAYRDQLRYDDAARATARARALAPSFPAEVSTSAPVDDQLAYFMNAMNFYAALGLEEELAEHRQDWPGALTLRNQMLAISRSVVERFVVGEDGPARRSVESVLKRQVARDLHARSRIYQRLSRFAEAVSDGEESVAIRARIVEIDPDDDRRAELASARLRLSFAYLEARRGGPALESVGEALEELGPVLRRNPGHQPARRATLLAALQYLAILQSITPPAPLELQDMPIILGLQAAEALFRADPTAENRSAYLDLLQIAAGQDFSLRRVPQGLEAARRLRDAARSAPQDGPNAALLARRGAAAEYYLAKHGSGAGDWNEVVRMLGRVGQSETLTAEEQAMLVEAQAAVAAAGAPR